MQDQIRYVKRKDIDTQKWDDRIRNSSGSIIYGYAFYLDCMAEQWDALIWNDYEMIMPMPWKKKYGIRYLYQPFFTQQSGIFSKQEITPSIIEAFLLKVKAHFQFAEIHLNFGNGGFLKQQLNNFILSLHHPYQEICLSYKKDLKKNLAHSKKFQLTYSASQNYQLAIAQFRETYSRRMKVVKKEHYLRLERLCKMLYDKGMVLVREVNDRHHNLLATALCLKDEKRIYLLLSSITPVGKKCEANHFLIDSLIREFQSSNLLLDFEGSDIPGIAHFYKNFGSINQPYFYFRYNNLPWPLRLFKKN